MIPAIMDFEASGLGRGSYPIEVGYVLGDGRSACFLIRPEPEWVGWSEEAQQLHGIDRDLLMRKGHPVQQVAYWLNHQLAGETLYTDAWGSDLTWLSLLFDAADRVPRFRLQSLRVLLCEGQEKLWHETHATISRELAIKRHRASGDARLLQQTFIRTRALIAEAKRAALNFPPIAIQSPR